MVIPHKTIRVKYQEYVKQKTKVLVEDELEKAETEFDTAMGKAAENIKNADGSFTCTDEFDHWIDDGHTELKTVFKDGKLIKFYDFMDIRRRMYG